MTIVKKLLSWYFSKDALPYWCLLLIDTFIVFISGLFTYWVLEKTLNMFEHRFEVLFTACFYAILSWVGAKLFSTYSNIVRYSSFVDLLHIAYANALSLILAIICSYGFEAIGWSNLCGLTQTEIVMTFFLAMLLMWAVRIVVKNLHDVVWNNEKSMRVLIYGAMTSGIGLAKNIRSQKPSRFRLCGFISNNERARHMTLLGEKIYYVDDDIASVIEKEHIQAVLVSPTRLRKFQDSPEFQDVLIKSGVKIYIAQFAKEVDAKGEKLKDEDFAGVQMTEVQVEDLLPRQEIKVDMDSVGEMLTGKRVLITGSAGSIGSEMVRQIAVYQPAAMMLIDQAETPQHDISLMVDKYPDIETEVMVTSICHEHRMDRIFRQFRPDYVFHAAAYKHVPMMEHDPSEAVLNNIHGTKVIADLSVKYGVRKFVMVSTDKAVNPTNVMGC